MHRSAQVPKNARCCASSVLVSVVVADPVLCRFRILISSLRNQIEVVIGGVHHVDAPRIARVGVKDSAALVLVEHAGSLTVLETGTRFRIVVRGCSSPEL